MFMNAVNKFNSLPRSKKIQLCIAVVLTLLVIASLPVMAWFTGQKKLAAMAKVDSPSVIVLSAGHNEGIVNLDLSDIDVTLKDDDNNRITSKQYVFCVAGSDTSEYMLQLAYTTNNQFEYFIYPARELGSSESTEGAVKYLSSEVLDENDNKVTFYYVKDTTAAVVSSNYVVASGDGKGRLLGEFLNSDDGLIAKDDTYYKQKAYDSYTNIQKYARPIYWQTTNSIASEKSDNNPEKDERVPNKEFLNYYILEVSWDKALKKAQENNETLSNSKETDIIYITAKAK